jgi:hypothetical protein
MKRRTAPTPGQIEAALRMYEAARPEPARTARVWRIHWLTVEPTTCRYQEPVCLARVLSEHRAAIAAEPLN